MLFFVKKMPFLRDLVDLVRILRIFSQNLARFCSNLLVTLVKDGLVLVQKEILQTSTRKVRDIDNMLW